MEEKFRELKELMLLGEIDGDELVRRYREFAGIDDEQALAALLDETELARLYGSTARGSFELPVRMEIARQQCEAAAAFCDATIDSSELESAATELMERTGE